MLAMLTIAAVRGSSKSQTARARFQELRKPRMAALSWAGLDAEEGGTGFHSQGHPLQARGNEAEGASRQMNPWAVIGQIDLAVDHGENLHPVRGNPHAAGCASLVKFYRKSMIPN